MYSRRILLSISPTAYQQHVKNIVLNFKNTSEENLSESSLQILDRRVKDFAKKVRIKWKSTGYKTGRRFYKKFQNNMEDPFMWTPELKDPNKVKEKNDELLI